MSYQICWKPSETESEWWGELIADSPYATVAEAVAGIIAFRASDAEYDTGIYAVELVR